MRVHTATRKRHVIMHVNKSFHFWNFDLFEWTASSQAKIWKIFFLEIVCILPILPAFCCTGRLHFPCTLCGMQETFGRDYTTLSRINNHLHHLLYHQYSSRCVVSNLNFYRDRLDWYNLAMRSANDG